MPGEEIRILEVGNIKSDDIIWFLICVVILYRNSKTDMYVKNMGKRGIIKQKQLQSLVYFGEGGGVHHTNASFDFLDIFFPIVI